MNDGHYQPLPHDINDVDLSDPGRPAPSRRPREAVAVFVVIDLSQRQPKSWSVWPMDSPPSTLSTTFCRNADDDWDHLRPLAV